MAKKIMKQKKPKVTGVKQPSYPAAPGLPTGPAPWEVEQAGRSLMDAEQVKSDKKLHASAKKHLKKLSARAKRAAGDDDGDE